MIRAAPYRGLAVLSSAAIKIWSVVHSACGRQQHGLLGCAAHVLGDGLGQATGGGGRHRRLRDESTAVLSRSACDACADGGLPAALQARRVLQSTGSRQQHRLFGCAAPCYWAAAWIKQLVAEGITSGCGTGTYCLESPVTRAQMSVFLVKTFNLP